MRRHFDVRHPLFNPLWRRVLVVGLLAGWTLVEVMSGNPFWALVFGAAAAWCAYEFFVTWQPQEPRDRSR